MNLIKVFIITALVSSLAQATLTLSKVSSPSGDKTYQFSFDLNTLNEINDASDALPQEQVNEAWRSYLTAAVFHSPIEAGFYFNHDSLISTKLVIEGQLKLNLIRAIVSTYREDVETFYRLAPTAIKGKNRQEVKDNSVRFYNCLGQLALMSNPSPSCDLAHQLSTLEPAQYEELKSAYSRIVRSGSLSLRHCYSELHKDPFLTAQHIAIREALRTEQRILEGINQSSFFNREEAVMKWASLPFQSGKVSGTRLMDCRSMSSWPIGWFRSELEGR